MTEERIVIVGASLAGLRGAEALRSAGFQGKLTLVGDEKNAPYDRPPLSKHLLTGEIPTSLPALPNPYQLNAEWHLGVAATGLNIKNRTVELANGVDAERLVVRHRLPFDQLLITTGTRARPWSNPSEAALDGVFLIRNFEDAVKLREKLAAKPQRVVIIGGGFIGCEVASCCCELGLPVVLIQRGALLVHALGKAIGDIVAQMQREAGVDLRLGVSVSKIEGNSQGQVQRVHLSDGAVLDTDLVVVALGAVRNVEWLQKSGLAVSKRGVRCDQFCRVLDPSGAVVEGIFVAGDVAEWPHPLYDNRVIAIEHWGNAVVQAQTAAYNMVAKTAETMRLHDHLPDFWSSQFGVNIKLIGLPETADQLVFTQGLAKDRKFIAAYGEAGRTIAVVSFNSARWLPAYRKEINKSFPPMQGALEQFDCSPIAPEFASSHQT
ncbi:NAD(P)/FAD-dependent oxidoreductase [Nostoc sp.]|uniref:NAD(P)/FAD-dependent oxidoreductase n=1 Tax=Nostoc sp. TaxID=1180 RepID=UPI002FFAB2D6